MTREEQDNAIKVLRNFDLNNPKVNLLLFSAEEITNAFDMAIKALEQEPKTGHWIEHPEIETSTPEYLMFYECSECGDKQCFCKSDIHKKHFCNNCGAKMVDPQESEEEWNLKQ